MRMRIRLVLIALVALVLPPTAAGAQEPSLTLTSLSINTSALGQQARLGLAVTGPLQQWRIKLIVSNAPIATRSALSAPVVESGLVVQTPGTAALESGEVASLEVRADLGRRDVGAYPAAVELIAAGKVAARIDLFLSTLSSSAASREPLTFIWPLIDRPHRGVDGVFLDDGLAIQIAPGGRLDTLVKYATPAVTWAIDPELLAAIESMSTEYRVIDGEEIVERPANPDALRWLDALRAATARAEIIVLPQGDPDLLSLATIDPVRLQLAQQAGVRTLARILQRPPVTMITDIAWPASGRLAKETWSALKSAGYSALITNSREIPSIDGTTYTPSARAGDVEEIAPLVADAIASTWASTGDLLAATRTLAEIATITAERPARVRPQLIAPARIWNPSPAALALLTSELPDNFAPIGTLRESTAQTRGTISYSGGTFSENHLAAARTAWADVRATETAVGQSLESNRLLAAAPVAATLRDYTPRGLLQEITKSSRRLVHHVRILPGRYTLTAKEQEIPVTVVNDFEWPARVLLFVAPHAPRVVASGAQSVEVPARGRTQVLVPITSVATGVVAADAYLTTVDGKRYGDGQVLSFDVRSIGPVASWVLWGSTALLALAVTLRLTRRIRQVRKAAREGS